MKGTNIFLLIMIFRNYHCENLNCNSTVENLMNWSLYRKIINDYGSINFAFAYRFFEGFSSVNNTSTSFLKILIEEDVKYRIPILLIESYKSNSEFGLCLPETFTYKHAIMKSFTATTTIVTGKFYRDQDCAKKVLATAWQVKEKFKFCVAFYACDVSARGEGFEIIKKIIFMTDSTYNLSKIQLLNPDENEYEGNFSKFINFEGEEFCICDYIKERLSKRNKKNGFQFTKNIEYGIIIFTFLAVFFILFEIYSCLAKESVFEKSIRVPPRIIMVRSQNQEQTC